MQNVSGFLSQILIQASSTFPVPGFYIKDFSDDQDPIDFPDMVIGEGAMSVNGTLVYYTKPNPVNIKLSVIPGSYSDIQLGILWQANRAEEDKMVAFDIITMTLYYSNLTVPVTLSKGIITSGSPGTGIASSARLKTKNYSFMFQSVVGGF